MPYMKSGGIELYYEVHGEGIPIIFAHGRGGGHLVWWQQVPVFAKDFKVVTFDQRGYGLSKDIPSGPGRAAFADDLLNLMDHLEIPAAYLVGQSMGGWTILSFAVQHPERTLGLLLSDTSAGISEEAIFAAYRERGEPPAQVFARAISQKFKDEEPLKAFLYKELGDMNPPAPDPLMALLLSDVGPTAADLAGLEVPAKFVVGALDIVVPPSIVELCVGFYPGAEVEVVADAGHSVYFERPEVYNRILADFIARTEQAR